ncbi:hypothetical protein N7486_009356, partial [Penicillium sp. IBT 16267x]
SRLFRDSYIWILGSGTSLKTPQEVATSLSPETATMLNRYAREIRRRYLGTLPYLQRGREWARGWADNMTVLDTIEEDACEDRLGDPDLYAEALSFYAQTSSEDTHATDVLDMLQRVGREDAVELEKRKTYVPSCCTYTIRDTARFALVGKGRDSHQDERRRVPEN